MTLFDVLQSIPIGSAIFVCVGFCFLCWYDRKHGSVYERSAREIESHLAELQARHPKK